MTQEKYRSQKYKEERLREGQKHRKDKREVLKRLKEKKVKLFKSKSMAKKMSDIGSTRYVVHRMMELEKDGKLKRIDTTNAGIYWDVVYD